MTQERILYIVNGAIPSWRVLMALHEKGLPFVSKRLRVMRAERETKTSEFLALNPRGQTPLLIEPDGTKVNESLAILHYLEMRYPKPALMPAQDDWQVFGRVIAWIQEAETSACAYDPMEKLFLKKPSEMSDFEKEQIKKAIAAVRFELDLWEARTAQHTFIASEQFTLADCAFYPLLSYLMRRGLDLAPWHNLKLYELRVRARPSAQASYPEGWQHNKASKPNLFQLAEEV